MKKLLLILVLIGLFAFSNAQSLVIIQGQVTDQSSGAGVPYYAVQISTDSSSSIFFYNNTVYTNSQGYYIDTVVMPSMAQTMFYIVTMNCTGTPLYHTGVSTTSPITANFSICTGGTTTCNCYLLSTVSGLTATFDAYTNSSYLTNYVWSFGDGSGGTGQNISHTYTQAGVYNISLTSVDSAGCVSSTTGTVAVGNATSCQANFTVYPDTSLMGYSFYFMNLSLGTNLSYVWNFGDGNISNLANPQHTYTQAGGYTICLTITELGSGCSSTFCDSLIVGSTTTCAASFTAQTNSSLTASFISQATGVAPYSYIWYFGDGNTSSLANPSHTYASQGTYTVTLWVADASGCQASNTQTIQVGGSTTICQASFVYAPDSLFPNNVYFYSTSSSGNPTYPINSYLWSFGDGTGSTLQSPSHQYNSPGYYVVCLTITTGSVFQPMCTSVYCDSVYAGGSGACSIYFGWQATQLNATFNATASGTPPFSYTWSFGDGTTGTGASPTHTYASAGTYTVTASLLDANGCYSSSYQTITISQQSNQQMYGQIIADSLPAGQVSVVLMGFNPGSGMFIADTALTAPNGSYSFSNVPQGVYLLRAEPVQGTLLYSTHAPTYYVSSLNWGTATMISLGTASNPYNINLLPIPGPIAGPAAAGGTVSNGGVKMSTKGDPMGDIEVMLKDSQGAMLDLRYSDISGHFDFTGIAYGTYEIYAEVPGLPTIPASITLNATNPAITNIDIIVMSNGVVTIIPEIPELTSLNLFPNPAQDRLFVDLGSSKALNLHYELISVDGRILKSGIISGDQVYEIGIKGFADGVYLFKLTDEVGNAITRKIIVR